MTIYKASLSTDIASRAMGNGARVVLRTERTTGNHSVSVGLRAEMAMAGCAALWLGAYRGGNAVLNLRQNFTMCQLKQSCSFESHFSCHLSGYRRRRLRVAPVAPRRRLSLSVAETVLSWRGRANTLRSLRHSRTVRSSLRSERSRFPGKLSIYIENE